MVYIETQIANTQHILHLLRQSMEMSGAEFGKKIGVTRQTINNIENKKYKLDKTVYLAMRYIFSQYPNNKLLNDLLYIFIDHYDKFKPHELTKIQNYAEILIPQLSNKRITNKQKVTIYTTWDLLVAKSLMNAKGADYD